MTRQRVRKAIIIALVVLLFTPKMLDPTSGLAANPMANDFVFYSILIWSVAVLVHVFWMNRKLFLSYFAKVPNLSRRGQLQIVVLSLTVFQIGLLVLNFGMEWSTVVFWWVIVFVLLLIVHIWLNRKVLSSYFGRRWSMAIFALCCLGFASLIIGGLAG